MKNLIAFIAASLAFISGLFLAAFTIAGIFQLLLAGKLDPLGLKIFITILVIFVTSFWLTKKLNFASSPEETKKPTHDKYQLSQYSKLHEQRQIIQHFL